MNFISPEFALLLSITFLLYWFVFKKNGYTQNILLLVASLVFYTWNDWRFTVILIGSVLFNFFIGRKISYNKMNLSGRRFLITGIVINFGCLLIFKSLNGGSGFFIKNFTGNGIDTSDILLPLGISFYTFQALGYLIDVYNEEIEASNNLLSFFVFLTYFPKMAAGPIEPANRFLPQILLKRSFEYSIAVDGMRQILWGVFTKLVIANNCASFAHPVFENPNAFPGNTLLLASFFYLLQVYCDFSGYSNIAIGVSKLFGLQLSRNFHAPFLAVNIREYWQRWHITLTQWVQKYIFIPLSFSLRDLKRTGTFLSVLTSFIIIGLWHGFTWPYFTFGFLHGLYFIPLIFFPSKKIQNYHGSKTASKFKWAKTIGLFLLIMLTCIIFGSSSLHNAIRVLGKIFSSTIFSSFVWPPFMGAFKTVIIIFCIIVLLLVEWMQKDKEHELQLDGIKDHALRNMIYILVLLSILTLGSVMHHEFIYSQF